MKPLQMFLTLLTIAMLAGCEEEHLHGSLTTKQLLTQHEWVLAGHGFDDNKNGLLDEEENLIQECQTDNSYIFHVDGTGLILDNELLCGTPDTFQFNWKLSESGKKIEINHEALSIILLNKDKLILAPQLSVIVVDYILNYERKAEN
jgi:hypothetical protein